MFRLAKVVLCVTVTTGAAGLAVERGCKLRSYSDPALFKYVKFGLTTPYCATMISADSNNFRYAQYSPELGREISERLQYDRELCTAVTTNSDFIKWFTGGNDIETTNFDPDVIENMTLAAMYATNEISNFWDNIDQELYPVLRNSIGPDFFINKQSAKSDERVEIEAPIGFFQYINPFYYFKN